MHGIILRVWRGEHKMERALKHCMIAVKGGSAKSLSNIKLLYSEGTITKDDYAKALRSHQAYLDEIKSDQRDEAALLMMANTMNLLSKI